ncbi:MAG: nuclear transport factor 2 family protein [Flavobacteriales bacterium]|nr:nuclear transport factor 2 family protein [Flavobacteriales bacterium]
MNKLLIVLMTLTVLGSCNNTAEKKINSSNRETMEKQDKQQIEQLLNTYKTSLNTSDAKLSTGLYTKDGMFMPSGAPTATEAKNIQKSYEYVFSQIQLTIEFFIEEIVIEGNMAFATTTSKGTTLIHANGQTVPEENRELFVFEKVSGEWKIARYMFNKMSPQK